jgi:ATP-dependent DNA ligase
VRQKRFVRDGDAVLLGVDGVPDFNTLHSRKHDHEAQLYAFDCLALDGDDLRGLLRRLSSDASPQGCSLVSTGPLSKPARK